ncbi:MAG: porin family protein [Colwellia sp.]|nr:porin family protein [Colwellia sp.]
MKTLTKPILPLVIMLTAGFGAQAYADNTVDDTDFKRHTFGAHIAAGGVEYKGSSSDDGGVVQFYSYYNYAVNGNFSLEVGLNVAADVDVWECEEVNHNDWRCSDINDNLFGQGADEIEFSNLVLAVKGTLPLSQRNSLYVKVGVQSYRYDLYSSNETIADDSGTGLYLAAGWQYRWDFGLGINVGYEAFNMGDLDTYTLNTGLSYQF